LLRPSMPTVPLWSACNVPPIVSCSCAVNKFSPPEAKPLELRLPVEDTLRSQPSKAIQPPEPQPFSVLHGPPVTSIEPLTISAPCPSCAEAIDTEPPAPP